MAEESDVTVAMMGGTVTVAVAHSSTERARAAADLRQTVERMRVWAGRLTRFDPGSELRHLNLDTGLRRSWASPLLASVLACAERLARASAGTIDIGMLDARLSAEGALSRPPTEASGWWLERSARGAWVHRFGQVAFDLDGVTKGWMADRALRGLARYPAALVDADGDIACRDDDGVGWTVAVADPADDAGTIGTIDLAAAVGSGSIGVATSGVTRSRWQLGRQPSHHLIDPQTRRPATGDVAQATIVASTATLAEGLAKATIIDQRRAADWIGREAFAGIVRHADGRTRVLPGSDRWLER